MKKFLEEITQQQKDESLIHYAKNKNLEMVKWLLKEKANPNYNNADALSLRT